MAMPQSLLAKNKTVYGFIKNYINNKAVNSVSTAENYERDIRTFFRELKSREIEELTKDDLVVTNEDVENYKTHLANIGYAPSSIARMISSVKKLYSKLEANNHSVKEAWFNIDKVKGSGNSWGHITWEQMKEMQELVKDEVKGDIKALLFETAVVTCFRQKSLLNMTWDKLIQEDGVWTLRAEDDSVGKGKKDSVKAIDDGLYERLISLKDKYKSDRIFPLEKRTVTTTIVRLRKKMGLDDDIVFHSFKNCGINEAYEISGGDIMAVAEQGDHESFGTTMRHYMRKKKKLSEMVSLKIGKPVDVSPLESLSREELIDIINKSSRSTQLELINKLNK
jgi:site-specific recombinase XerD